MLLLLAAIYNAIIPRAVISNMWLNRLSDIACRYWKSASLAHVAQNSKAVCIVLLAPCSNKWTSETGD